MHDGPCKHGYLTESIPGIGGKLKVMPEDFIVEEIAAYEPTGEGDHLFLRLEKRGVSADQLVRRVAAALDIAPRDIGCAGLKDTHAVTRQYLSVPASAEAGLGALESLENIRLLHHARHGNKLKTGHLRGNRFKIIVRDVPADALPRARDIADVLRARGVPNFYGAQRFGRDGETLQLGLSLLRGDDTPLRRVPAPRRGFMARLALSSVQSELFNRYLEARRRDALLHTVLLGDYMEVVASGGPFYVTDVAREQARFDAHEVVTTGPMFGAKMRTPQGEALARETEALAASGIDMAAFAPHRKLMPGTRRATLIYVDDLEVLEPQAGTLGVSFTLPAGAYATVVLRELMKT